MFQTLREGEAENQRQWLPGQTPQRTTPGHKEKGGPAPGKVGMESLGMGLGVQPEEWGPPAPWVSFSLERERGRVCTFKKLKACLLENWSVVGNRTCFEKENGHEAQ